MQRSMDKLYESFKRSPRVMRTVLLLALLTSILFTSCRKDKPDGADREVPTITLLSTVPAMVQGEACGEVSDRMIELGIDDTMTISVRFADDVELGSAKFDLHHNFDCHGHRGGGGGSSVLWNILDIVELSGKEQVMTRTWSPPQNVRPGLYHMMIQCLDALGKEAQWTLIDVRVIDTEDSAPPVIVLDEPLEGASIMDNGPIVIRGNVSDDVDLGTGFLQVSFITNTGIELAVARVDYPKDAGTSVPFDLSYTIPSFVPRGNATLKLEAGDRRNNVSVAVRTLVLTD